jgi:hypothetical protein
MGMKLAERLIQYLSPTLRERELLTRIIELESDNADLAMLCDMYKAERDRYRKILDAMPGALQSIANKV